MSSDNRWKESYGELRLPFFGAAGKIVDGDFHVTCPNCRKSTLRFYYHKFNTQKDTGTLWAWCPHCRVTTHLPRVSPKGWDFPDPFRDLSPDAFAELEDSDEPLVSKLDRLWVRGQIGIPEASRTKLLEQGRPKPTRR